MESKRNKKALKKFLRKKNWELLKEESNFVICMYFIRLWSIKTELFTEFKSHKPEQRINTFSVLNKWNPITYIIVLLSLLYNCFWYGFNGILNEFDYSSIFEKDYYNNMRVLTSDILEGIPVIGTVVRIKEENLVVLLTSESDIDLLYSNGDNSFTILERDDVIENLDKITGKDVNINNIYTSALKRMCEKYDIHEGIIEKDSNENKFLI